VYYSKILIDSAYIVSVLKLTDDEKYLKGIDDASVFYKKYKRSRNATTITSIISPVIGLIPTIAIAASKVDDKNLNFPN
jgi:hypothetical protein